MTNDKQHYSYQEYAKTEIAEGFDELRFGGPIGSLLRELQDEQLQRWITEPAGKKILDIGAGTGRTAIPLALAGADVLAADASEAMLEVAKKNAAKLKAELSFSACDVMNLPMKDGTFDLVMCFRVLMHVTDWQKGVAEICRVCGDELIFDFPPRWTLAGLQVPMRAMMALFDSSVQNYRLFSLRQIRKELLLNGFEIAEVDKLWVLPIGFHKLFGSRRFTLLKEKVLAAIGLRRLFGAPVTIRAKRVK
jgi:ubiquinone/menaquinone biosynthesis C-methylase UbiE